MKIYFSQSNLIHVWQVDSKCVILMGNTSWLHVDAIHMEGNEFTVMTNNDKRNEILSKSIFSSVAILF